MNRARSVVVALVACGAGAFSLYAWASPGVVDTVRDYLSFANAILFPGIWWAASITGKVDRLHGEFSKMQALETRVTVLEVKKYR